MTNNPLSDTANLPAAYAVLVDADASFKQREDTLDETAVDRHRRWRREIRRNAASSIVRLRAYGEARLLQMAINDDLVPGTKMRLARWDHAHGWSPSHACNAVKVQRAWLAEGGRYPVSWSAQTVTEILRSMQAPRKPAARADSVRRQLGHWMAMRDNPADTNATIVVHALPRLIVAVRRAVESMRTHDDDVARAFIGELRQLLSSLENAETKPLVDRPPTPAAEDDDDDDDAPTASARDTPSSPPPDIEDQAVASGTNTLRHPPSLDIPLTNLGRPSDVPNDLVFLDHRVSRNTARERFRRSDHEWRLRDGARPVATYRRSTLLWRRSDLIRRVAP